MIMVLEQDIRLCSIPSKNWRFANGARLNENGDWPQIREKILKRDSYTCFSCGFHSTRYMEVHHRSGAFYDDREINLVTFCPLCHSCFHIGLSGMKQKGVLVVLDTENEKKKYTTQVLLNRFVLEESTRGKLLSSDMLIDKFFPGQKNLGSEGLVVLANELNSQFDPVTGIAQATEAFRFIPNPLAYPLIKELLSKAALKNQLNNFN